MPAADARLYTRSARSMPTNNLKRKAPSLLEFEEKIKKTKTKESKGRNQAAARTHITKKQKTTMGIKKSPRQGPLPVTLLSGFLGSGKTTLLKHILTSKDHGLKVCVIVNDMAALNIDAAYTQHLVQREEKMVQMQNGCICCTLREDLLVEVSKLAKNRSFDYLVIESTGISEPMQVAETFAFALPGQPELPADSDACPATLMSVARLDTCVTVVDCASFQDNITSIEELKDRYADDVEEGDARNISSLLVDQIEFADVIMLNKSDMVNKEQLARIRQLVTQLNPSADVHVTQHSKVDIRKILDTKQFSMEKAAMNAGWLKAINDTNTAGKSESEEYGVTSFVYRARRPFHPGRLYTDFLSKYFLTRVHKMEPHNAEFGDEVEAGDSVQEATEGANMINNNNSSAAVGPASGSSGSDDTLTGTDQGRLPTSPDNNNVQPGFVGSTTEGNKRSKVVVDLGSASNDDDSEDESDDDGEGSEADQEAMLKEFQEARQKAMEAKTQDLGNLLRSKGYFWTASCPDDIMTWSHAGVLLTVVPEGRWFTCLPESEWPEDPEIRSKIREDFDPAQPEVGDRRQELVFIGQGLKESAIRAALDACLATPQEIEAGRRGELDDPLMDDDEDEEDHESGDDDDEPEEEDAPSDHE